MKQIKIHNDTYETLTKMKLDGETYDEVICRALKISELCKLMVYNFEKEKRYGAYNSGVKSEITMESPTIELLSDL